MPLSTLWTNYFIILLLKLRNQSHNMWQSPIFFNTVKNCGNQAPRRQVARYSSLETAFSFYLWLNKIPIMESWVLVCNLFQCNKKVAARHQPWYLLVKLRGSLLIVQMLGNQLWNIECLFVTANYLTCRYRQARRNTFSSVQGLNLLT